MRKLGLVEECLVGKQGVATSIERVLAKYDQQRMPVKANRAKGRFSVPKVLALEKTTIMMPRVSNGLRRAHMTPSVACLGPGRKSRSARVKMISRLSQSLRSDAIRPTRWWRAHLATAQPGPTSVRDLQDVPVRGKKLAHRRCLAPRSAPNETTLRC